MSGSNRAVFLDRDGTIVQDVNYLHKAEQLRLMPGAADAIARLRQAGFLAIVATNQSAIAKGLLTEAELGDIHRRLGEMLAEANPDARLDGIYYCPYHPEAEVVAYRQSSYLRKPRPGMLFKAAREFQLDLGSCWMIGDGERDVQAGQAVGSRAILLSNDLNVTTDADRVARTLSEAVDIVLATPGRTPLRPAAPAAAPAITPATPPATPAPTTPPAPLPPKPAPAKAPPPPPPAATPAPPARPPSPAPPAATPPSPVVTERPAEGKVEATPAATPEDSQPAREVEEEVSDVKSSDPPTTPPEPQADADQTTEDEDAEAAEAATLSRTGHRPLGDVRRRLMAEIEEEMKEKQNPSADESTAAPRSRDAGDTRKVLAEILQQLRQLNRSPEKREFSATKILGGLFQVISWGLLGLGLNSYFQNQKDVTDALVWGVAAVFTQVASLAFFLMHHQD